MTSITDPRLVAIRSRMSEAAKRKDVPAYKAAAAEHRAIIKAERPDLYREWLATGGSEDAAASAKVRFA